MHRLSRVETERVMAVMDSTIKKLDIVSRIPEKQDSELVSELKLSHRDRLQHLWFSESASSSKPQNLRVLIRQVIESAQRDTQMQDLLETKCQQQSSIETLKMY